MRVVGVEPDDVEDVPPDAYWQACRLAEQGEFDEARRLYAELEEQTSGAGSRSISSR